VDPEEKQTSMQGGLIKFRVAAGDKLLIANAATKAGTTVSELLRRAGRAAASGRIASRCGARASFWDGRVQSDADFDARLKRVAEKREVRRINKEISTKMSTRCWRTVTPSPAT
jgi:NADPH:quinone reductase-like Zn-dependent oxidoreductase